MRTIRRAEARAFAQRVALAAFACAALSLGFVAKGAAQPYGAEATVDADRGASPPDETISSTSVEVDDRARALGEIEALFSAVPGVRLSRTGTTGSFSGLSIRGADLDHTSVYFEGIALDPPGGGAFDLSIVPLAWLGAMRVHRGGAPFELGAEAIGGVVELVGRDEAGPLYEARSGGGSFGRIAGGAASAVGSSDSRLRSVAIVGANHTKGDFPYLDDNGTLLDPTDDVERRRQNAGLDDGFGLLRLRKRLLEGELSLIVAGYAKAGGFSGSPVEEPTRAREQRLYGLSALRYRRGGGQEGGRWRLDLQSSFALGRRRLSDLYGEIARPPRLSDDRASRVHSRLSFARELGRVFELSALLQHAYDAIEPHDALLRIVPPTSSRHRASLHAQGRVQTTLGSTRFITSLRGRLELVHARLAALDDTFARLPATTDWLPSVSAAIAIEPWRFLRLVASGGSAHRAPSLLELFGDRGFLVGDVALRPERGQSLDLSAVLSGRAGILAGRLEARAFALYTDDLIRWVRNAQYRLVPQNIGRGRVLGGELGVRGRLGAHFLLVGQLTLLQSRDLDRDQPLPFRPPITAYVRPTFRLPALFKGRASFGLWADLMHIGASTLTPSGLELLPARTLFGLGVSLAAWHGRANLQASVRDLFDARPYDLVGYPLPGRRWSLELLVRSQ